MRKLIFAFDSFKGSLTSQEANTIASNAAKEIWPDIQSSELIMADGGEGTAAAFISTCEYEWTFCDGTGPLGEPHHGRYAVNHQTKTAVIDCADSAGLPSVPVSRRNPELTSSKGVGTQILDAINRGCRHIIIAVGGTATVDCGTGILHTLGFRFYDNNGKELTPCGKNLSKIAQIDAQSCADILKGIRFTVLHDVGNPLCGTNGAITYAPQKGADATMCDRLSDGIQSFAATAHKAGYPDNSKLEGAGAGGGIAWAMKTFFNADFKYGAKAVLELTGFASHASDARLILTGEGCIAATTLNGKAPYAVLLAAQKIGVPVVAIGGIVRDHDLVDHAGFLQVFQSAVKPYTVEEAMQPEVAKRLLSEAVKQAIQSYMR